MQIVVTVYNHPEVNGIWARHGMFYASIKDPILSCPGWLYVHVYVCVGMLYRIRGAPAVGHQPGRSDPS